MSLLGRRGPPNPWYWLGVVAAVLVALGLRVWGIGFGLPELYHPDEPAYVLQALAVARGLPDGLTFANPPLYKYLLVGEYALTYGVQRMTGATTTPQDFVSQFRVDPSLLYLIDRLTSAVFGAATCVAAVALGSVVSSRRVGLIAAWLTAVTYFPVRDSHFGVNDTLVTLLATCGLVCCVRIVRGGGRADYLAAGGLAGLAFAAKYDGIVLLVPLALAHALRPAEQRRNVDLAAGGAACIMAAAIAFPSLLTETARVLHDIYLHLYVPAVAGYDGLDPSGGYVYYAVTVMPVGLGWPLLLAALAGLGLMLTVRRSRAMLVLGSLPLALIAVLGAQHLYFARFLLPAVPALLVAAGVALDGLLELRPLLGVATCIAASTPTLIDSVRFDVLLTRQDTRSQARVWIDTHVSADQVIAVDSPPIGPNLTPRAAQLALLANAWSLFDLSASEYRARGVTYLVTSSFSADVRLIDQDRDRRRRTFYQALPGEAEPLAEFRPTPPSTSMPEFVYDQLYGPFNALDKLQRPGPLVRVYRLTDAGRGTPP